MSMRSCIDQFFPCHPVAGLLRRSKNALGVMPWLDHGIQKIIKNTNIISIFYYL
ncbi:MAG: hypothetical protein ACRYE8_02750 [Janthinobacterium lividum]